MPTSAGATVSDTTNGAVACTTLPRCSAAEPPAPCCDADQHDRGHQDAPLVRHTHLDRAVLRRGQADQHQPGDHHDESDPVGPTQSDVQDEGLHDGRDREEARDDRLHDEEGERADRGDAQREAQAVERETQEVSPAADQAEHESRIEAGRGAGPARGDGLQHRPHAVAQGGTERAEQAGKHVTTLPTAGCHGIGVLSRYARSWGLGPTEGAHGRC
jgi:hypothetical protein